MKMDQKKIGEFIAALRKERGWTQEELGSRLNVSNKTVSRWETGNYMPPIEMLAELGREFEVSLNELVVGQRLDEKGFRETADQNLVSAWERSPIDRMWSWIKKHGAFTAVVLVLCVILAAALKGLYDYKSAHPADVPLHGSYCAGDPAQYAPGMEYLVFNGREGQFYRYRQHEPMVEEGTYVQNGEFVTLTGDTTRQAIIKGDQVFLQNPDEEGYTVYRKFSDILIFLGVILEPEKE